MNNSLYPLKFEPILKDKIWGGEKLHQLFNKASKSKKLGESWEISAVPDNISVVSNGILKGQSLQDLVLRFKSKLLGEKNWKQFGEEFPLLIKFIDAKENLSIQLHPNDALAKERHNASGKTEMWYVMQADDEAKIIVGFKEKVDREIYLRHLEDKTLTDILNVDDVKEGDAYFIESGRVHAIGAGVLLAEIQQTSDVTYRVYDWDRVDSNGNKRELHNDIAIDAFDFEMDDNFRICYHTNKNRTNEMVICPFFTTNYIDLDSEIKKQNSYDSFIIYMCVDGDVEIITNTSNDIIVVGETILIPASIKEFTLKSTGGKLLEVYV
ncbi:mannose-6-phosphate isomerase type 1 [Winogradskyella epiphytica]|uniref:Phosphohexomutase n=1 Tax=Winogradskyella epiphytica TaxID=262005 RepID=A0A2V4XCL8_9FLAO|nr:type I phosphomannose isomerase catalytic subunit [Winogradskyella epiphytica]PYE80080.1 mannose-6-phosphate isomerase type 1 [Winogradskyella epiphytica]GGW71266.1 mannose-6-phosphate isomerase [Winogradskyella epiphytica]